MRTQKKYVAARTALSSQNILYYTLQSESVPKKGGGSTNSANVFITTFVSDLSLAYGAPEGMLGEKTKTEQKTNKPIRNT